MWNGIEQRLNGERRRDWVCNHHDVFCERIDVNRRGIMGLKRILITGLGLIITILGFFAYQQFKVQDVVVAQKEIVIELKTILEYKVLPAIGNNKH